MKAKERMLIALNRGIPDRVPATIHQWQPYHLKHFMGGKTDIQAFMEVGLDAAVTCTPLISEPAPDWNIIRETKGMTTDFTIETPEGNLHCKPGFNEYTSWVTEHLVKKHEDIYLIKKYMPVLKLDKGFLSKYYDELGDEGIMRTFIKHARPGAGGSHQAV